MRESLAALLLVGCAAPAAPGPGDDRCEVTARVQALTAAERKVVGEASPYPADTMLRAREAELVASKRARREAAWAAVARAIEPVVLAEDLPAHEGPETLPRWQTWYGKDDLGRIFQAVWRALPGELRDARAPIPDDALAAGFAWNPRAVEELEHWPEERWLEYLASLDDELDVGGAGGIGRVGHDPAAARHLLASYAEEVQCLETGAPPAFVDGPASSPTVTREALVLGACEERVFGPYFVAGGETLLARATGAARGAAIAIDRDGEEVCAGDGTCAIDGPGAVWVRAASTGDPIDGELVVEHTAPDAPWAPCLAGRFPQDAAIIKASWHRAELGFELPVHDTSGPALAARLAGDAAWTSTVTADPGADAIYTVRAASGNVYRLAALHLMTRELDHWLWVTLWWSPEPDGDFGADRPASIDGVWRNYKMCVVAGFDERDPDPAGGFAASHPALAAALAATHGAASWCSNPYLEAGHGNAATNCIGCHQHGGTEVTPEALLGAPDHGAGLVRNNFPSDYAWSTNRGDHLARMLRDEIEYWDDVE